MPKLEEGRGRGDGRRQRRVPAPRAASLVDARPVRLERRPRRAAHEVAHEERLADDEVVDDVRRAKVAAEGLQGQQRPVPEDLALQAGGGGRRRSAARCNELARTPPACLEEQVLRRDVPVVVHVGRDEREAAVAEEVWDDERTEEHARPRVATPPPERRRPERRGHKGQVDAREPSAQRERVALWDRRRVLVLE